MTLLDMLAKPVSNKPLGTVDRILLALKPDEAKRVREVLADRNYPASQIVAALASAGHSVADTTVREYRRKLSGK